MDYHLDEDLSQRIAAIAREHFGLTVTSSHELGMDRATDEEQLLFTTEHGRCLVTRNGDDFQDLVTRLTDAGVPVASVLIVPRSMGGRQFFRIARALAYLNELYPQSFIPGFVAWLQDPPERWEPTRRP